MYSSILSSSGPSKREPGNPHSRKKSPVARQSATLTSLQVRIDDLLRRRARFTLALVAFEPSLWAISGMARSRGCPAAGDCSRWAGQVKMDRHLATFNLYIIEQPHFTQRTANFWVAYRASRRSDCLYINGHCDIVPATPVSVAGCDFTYSRLR